jgi:NitT/TauT family transport system substrate-binding protein
MRNVWVGMGILIMVLCVGQGYAAEPLQPMAVQLNWIPNVQFAGILLAKERGWYAEAGIDLTVKGWEEGVVVIDEVVAGKAQIGIEEGITLISARAAGKAVKAIAVDFQKTPYCLLSKKTIGIEQPKQLVGKKVGIDSPGTELMVKIILASQGLRFEDITPVPVGWDLQPLIKDELDAYPAYMNDQPLIMKEQGYEVTYIPAFKYGYDFYSGVYVVTEEMIQKQPELLQKFLNITLRGWREAFKDPAATAQLIVAKYYPDGSVPQQTASLEVFQMLATVGIGENLIGYMEEPFWAKGIDILEKYQQIDKKIPAKDLFTLEFLKKISSQK